MYGLSSHSDQQTVPAFSQVFTPFAAQNDCLYQTFATQKHKKAPNVQQRKPSINI